jgi:uncharacterized protein (TIGR02147 family)
MINLFDFTDFREYLRQYYEDKKKMNPHYSYELLTQKAHFSNRGFIHNIINGTRKLSKLNCTKLSQALGHTAQQADYFENIVEFTQANTEKERTYFLKQAFQGIVNAEIKMVGKDQFEYYSIWYHSVVRSLIDIFPVKNNYKQLGRKLSPAITADQVKESIHLLTRLGLVLKGTDGFYHLTGQHIRTSSDISQTARNKFHADCTELAKNAILNDPPDCRNVISMTLGLSRNMYDDIVKETQAFVTSIINIVRRSDEKPDRVYQYELLLFPLSAGERKKQAL